MTQKLSRFWQEEDDPRAPKPHLPPPWETIRCDAERSVAAIVVSHRVRRKVSGRLHKQTIYGDTGKEVAGSRGTTYRYFVVRKAVEELKNSESGRFNGARIIDIVDAGVRDIVRSWIDEHGGDPSTAFVHGYPKRGRRGPEIRKVRLRVKRQFELMTKASTGYADLGNNHHIAIYRSDDGNIDYDVVSLLEASRRLIRREPIVKRKREGVTDFVMSLSSGDLLKFANDGGTKLSVVRSVWSNGQVVLADHNDATHETEFRRRAKTIVEVGGTKISVDPIGRIRPAND